jgi:hypothetical protein
MPFTKTTHRVRPSRSSVHISFTEVVGSPAMRDLGKEPRPFTKTKHPAGSRSTVFARGDARRRHRIDARTELFPQAECRPAL